MKTFATSIELLNYNRKMLTPANYKNGQELKKLVEKLEELLKYDQEGHLSKLYKSAIQGDKSIKSKVNYLKGDYSYCYFQNLTFNFGIELFENLRFRCCTFENVTITEELKNFFKNDNIEIFENNNNLRKINFPNNQLSAKDIKTNRLGNSRYTCHVNLYVELDRICNAKCAFCRNNYYEKTAYDFKKVKKVLKSIGSEMDTIVIGGGEPTLRHDHLRKLSHKNQNNNIIISSNLSANPKVIRNLRDVHNYKFLVSRHAIEMEENAMIFGFDQRTMKNSEENMLFLGRNSGNTLSTVCFSGGIESYTKLLNYIDFAIDRGYYNILIQTLHQEGTVGQNEFDINNVQVDTSFINAVIKYLENKKYFVANPAIYSTAGYKSTVLRRGSLSIAFKEYLIKEQFEKESQTAVKRTVDLSLAPNGILYENWHQNSGEIELVKKKIFNFVK